MKNKTLYLLFATVLTLSMVLSACGVDEDNSPSTDQNWGTAAPMPKQQVSTPAPDANSDHKSYYNIRPYGQEYNSNWATSPEWVEKKNEFIEECKKAIELRPLAEGYTCERLWDDYLLTVN